MTTGGFQFGGSGTSGAPAAGGFSFGSGTTQQPVAAAAPAGGLSFGSGAAPPAAVTSSATAPSSGGLGGVALVGTGGLGGTAPPTGNQTTGKSAGDARSAKDAQIPAELLHTVETMRAHVKAQESECEVISRHSWTPVQRSGRETRQLCELRAAVAASVQQHTAASSRLKQELCGTLRGAEVAQRTADTSSGLQYENTAPQQLFAALVGQYELTLAAYSRQIEHMQRLLAASESGSFVSPDELVAALRRLHETFVWLAGQLHSVHERVCQLKEHFLLYRRQVLGDASDVFAAASGAAPTAAGRTGVEPCLTGPSPFSAGRTGVTQAVAAALAHTPQTSAPVAAALFGNPAPAVGLFGSPAPSTSAASLFGGSSATSSFLLDPPPGSKRGKV